jgi:hypothetical protein
MATADSPDIPEKSWTNPFQKGTFLHELYGTVVRQNRDLIVIVDDMNARRGTGKTVASMQLANAMDQTPEGLTWEKVSLEPEEIRNAYAEQPKRSGLVFDEAEVGASNRQAMSKANQALREIMSMGRVEQKYVVINAPLKDFIDQDLQKLADVWISLTRKGAGIVHHFQWERYSKTLMTPKKQSIEFEDIPGDHDLRNVYHKLTKAKRDKIGGEDGDGFVPMDEHEEKLKQERKQARQEARDEFVQGIFAHPEIQETAVSQRMVGEAIGVSQTTISNILQED